MYGSFGFSASVVQILTTVQSFGTLVEVTAAVNVHQVLIILAKLQAIATVNPTFCNIILANSDSISHALDRFFSAAPFLKNAIDIRSIPNLSSILATNNMPNIPALINLACLINLSVIFHQTFMNILQALIPTIAVILASVLVIVNQVLIILSSVLNNVLFLVIGLLGGVTATLNGLLGGVMYPDPLQVVSQFFPGVSQILGSSLLNQICLPVAEFAIPSPTLTQAIGLFKLLNCVG
jgi:hypothetical protein